jgi:hypothetical protein
MRTIKTDRFFAILIAVELTSLIFLQMKLIAIPFLIIFGNKYSDANTMRLLIKKNGEENDFKVPNCQVKFIQDKDKYEIISPRYSGFLETLKYISKDNGIYIEKINDCDDVIFVGVHTFENITDFKLKNEELFNYNVFKIFDENRNWIIFELKPIDLLNWIKLTKNLHIEIYDP